MIRGEYIFSEDGVELARSRNVVTWQGHRAIVRYLAGLVEGFGGTVAVGISDTSASEDDSGLGFEIGRAPVNMKSVKSYGTQIPGSDGNSSYLENAQIVFRGSLPETFVGNIYEVSLLSAFSSQYAAETSPRLLTAFDGNSWSVSSSTGFTGTANQNGIYSVTTPTQATPCRIGTRGMQFYDQTSSTSEPHAFVIRNDLISGDFGRYSQADQFALAAIFHTPTVTGVNINVKFFSDSGSYYTGVFNSGSLTANVDNYRIIKLTKSQFVVVGNPSWSNIAYCQVEMPTTSPAASGKFNILLDGLSVVPSALLTPDAVTISRAVLSVPLPKEAGKTLDVEYVMELDI